MKRNIEEIKMPRMSTDELKEILVKRLPVLGMEIDIDANWKIITLSRGLREPKMQPYILIQGIDSGELKTDALSILAAPEQPTLFPIGQKLPS